MRTIEASKITAAIKSLCMEANYIIEDDIYQALQQASQAEASPLGKEVLAQLLENNDIAKAEQLPICQDTGVAVVYVELGQDLHIAGGYLIDAINEGVRQGYKEGYLRKSMVTSPFNRVNTGDNTPAVVHLELVPGEQLKLTLAPKGGGSENMSALKMLKPAQGIQGVKEFVLETVEKAGPNACPPIVVGVGVGGTFEKSAMLAKEALLRPVGSIHSDPELADLEAELLTEINQLGIGPQGFGGTTTALAVHINVYPTHIACLPVAVNLNCHAARHKSAIL